MRIGNKRWDRLSLTDLLAKPHQRIPRYRLLIQVTAAETISLVNGEGRYINRGILNQN